MIVSRDLLFVLSPVGSSFVRLLWADPIRASGLLLRCVSGKPCGLFRTSTTVSSSSTHLALKEKEEKANALVL